MFFISCANGHRCYLHAKANNDVGHAHSLIVT